MTETGLFSQLVLRIAGGLLHFVWQGAALALLAAVCLAFVERRSAQTRYAIAVAFLAAMLAAPLLTVSFFSSADAILSQTLLLLGQPPIARLRTEQWASWIAAIWLAGVATGWIRLAVGWRLSLRLIRQAVAPDPEVSVLFERLVQQTGSGAVRLLVSVRAVSPVVIGWFRPVVLLPVTVLTGLSVEELCAVVAHELAHVRRHDYLVNMLQRVVESLLFYHPAVWWLSARVRAEREHAADEAAVEICDDPAVLASALVRLEETRSDRIAIAATGGSVANRVARLLNGEPDRSGWQPIMATVSFIGLWAIAGVWQFSAMESEAPRAGVSPIQSSSVAASAPVEAVTRGLGALAALAPAPPEKAAVPQSRTGVITGQVRDSQGMPAASFKVWAIAIREDGVGDPTRPVIASETDSQGRYRLENLPVGRYRVLAGSANSPTYSPDLRDDTGKILTVTAGATLSQVDFAVSLWIYPPPVIRHLTGQVRDTNGRPAGAKLWISAKPEVRTIPNIAWYIEETDSQGRYQMDIPAGRYTISIEPGNSVYRGRIIDAPQRTVIVAADQDVVLDLGFTIATPQAQLLNASSFPDQVQGRIEVDDGSPLPVGALSRFQVVLWGSGGFFRTQPFTNTQGIFTLPAVPGEYVAKVALGMRTYYLKSATYGNIDLTKGPFTLKKRDADTQMRIVLTRTRPADVPPGVKVSGRITDWRAGSGALALSGIFAPADLIQIQDVIPKDDGSFEIDGVPPGQYAIETVSSPKRSKLFSVGGTDVTNLELTIGMSGFPVPLTGSGKFIRGVIEAGNDAIPPFEVRFTPTGRAASEFLQAVKVSSREFSIILPEGEYRVSISGLPQDRAVKSVTAGPLDLTYPFLITYKGIADPFSGTPIASPGQMTIRIDSPASEK